MSICPKTKHLKQGAIKRRCKLEDECSEPGKMQQMRRPDASQGL